MKPASASAAFCCAALTRAGELLRLGDERGLLLLRRRGDRLAEGVLLGAQALEAADRRATGQIRRDRVIDELTRMRPASRCDAGRLGVLAEQLRVDHPAHSMAAAPASLNPWPPPSRPGTKRAAVVYNPDQSRLTGSSPPCARSRRPRARDGRRQPLARDHAEDSGHGPGASGDRRAGRRRARGRRRRHGARRGDGLRGIRHRARAVAGRHRQPARAQPRHSTSLARWRHPSRTAFTGVDRDIDVGRHRARPRANGDEPTTPSS